MKVLNDIHQYNKQTPSVVTIGSFDGVHIGHQQLLSDLKQLATKNGNQSVVISFDPHPRIFFNPHSDLKLLTTRSEKEDLIAQQNPDYLIFQKFDKAFANQTAEAFIQKLVSGLNMKHLLIGYDHHFGKDKSGNFEAIKSLEDKYNFKVHKINPVLVDNLPVSSTRIRSLLQNGDIQTANKLLGYPYQISGKVITGYQLGRKLGFPTANIDLKDPYKLLPKQGVYVVKSIIDNQPVYGMMNLGIRPTINGKKLLMEVHFFDFNKDIYHQEIPIYFLNRLRDEKKFDSLEALQEQLKKDKINALKMISD